jgi:hypothetical protein
MKKSFIILMLMLTAVAGMAGKMADDVFVQVCPRMFSVEIPGNLETTEWMDGKAGSGRRSKIIFP